MQRRRPVPVLGVGIRASLDETGDGCRLCDWVPPRRSGVSHRCRMQRFCSPAILCPDVGTRLDQLLHHLASVRSGGNVQRRIAGIEAVSYLFEEIRDRSMLLACRPLRETRLSQSPGLV